MRVLWFGRSCQAKLWPNRVSSRGSSCGRYRDDAHATSGAWRKAFTTALGSAVGKQTAANPAVTETRALAVEPEVVLMDEPCSALDPIATTKIEELIQALKTQYTIVIVTHNMQQAGRVSDFTAFFYLGKLIEFGPTVKIFTNLGEKQTENYITDRFG